MELKEMSREQLIAMLGEAEYNYRVADGLACEAMRKRTEIWDAIKEKVAESENGK